jgi:hypothetical protein
VTYRVNKRTGKSNFCYSRLVELWDMGHRRHVTNRIILVALKADTADIRLFCCNRGRDLMIV